MCAVGYTVKEFKHERRLALRPLGSFAQTQALLCRGLSILENLFNILCIVDMLVGIISGSVCL